MQIYIPKDKQKLTFMGELIDRYSNLHKQYKIEQNEVTRTIISAEIIHISNQIASGMYDETE